MQIIILLAVFILIYKIIKRDDKTTDNKNLVRIERKQPTYEEWKKSKLQQNANEAIQEKEQPQQKIQSQHTEPKSTKQNPAETQEQPQSNYDKQWQGWQWVYDPNQQGTSGSKQTPNKTRQPSNETHTEYKNAYRSADILTQNERNNYKILKSAADQKGYIICPKVRLADIITPQKGSQYMARFGKIKSKHVDFVIFDSEMTYPKAIIELDDSSHDRPDRQARDQFVDMILKEAGYKVIHTRHITPDILDNI